MVGGAGRPGETTSRGSELGVMWLCDEGEGVHSSVGSESTKPTEGVVPCKRNEQDFQR